MCEKYNFFPERMMNYDFKGELLKHNKFVLGLVA